jgi:phage shock protein C
MESQLHVVEGRTNVALYRSRDKRVLGGVCGGLAEWLDWDPTLVRILYIVLSIASIAFPGILVYLILWIVMPLEPRG